MAFRYLKVLWYHDVLGDPVVLFSEIGDDGYETRKVDQFHDGRLEWADATRETGLTALGQFPTPPIEEIAADEEFSPSAITAEEFEQVWTSARSLG